MSTVVRPGGQQTPVTVPAPARLVHLCRHPRGHLVTCYRQLWHMTVMKKWYNVSRSRRAQIVELSFLRERVCRMIKHPWNLLLGVLLTTTTFTWSDKTWMNRAWPCLRKNIWIFTADTNIASLFGISGPLFCWVSFSSESSYSPKLLEERHVWPNIIRNALNQKFMTPVTDYIFPS